MQLLVMTSGGGVSINDALGAERERCRRLSETSDVALAIVFVCREGRRRGPVLTGRVCQWRWHPERKRAPPGNPVGARRNFRLQIQTLLSAMQAACSDRGKSDGAADAFSG
jgi:hypothetical protein